MPEVKLHYNNPILYLGNIQPQLQLDVIKKIKSPYLIAADSMNLWIDLYPKLVWELLSKVDIFIKGPGAGRDSAIRSIQNAGLDVTSINDVTPLELKGGFLCGIVYFSFDINSWSRNI